MEKLKQLLEKHLVFKELLKLLPSFSFQLLSSLSRLTIEVV